MPEFVEEKGTNSVTLDYKYHVSWGFGDGRMTCNCAAARRTQVYEQMCQHIHYVLLKNLDSLFMPPTEPFQINIKICVATAKKIPADSGFRNFDVWTPIQLQREVEGQPVKLRWIESGADQVFGFLAAGSTASRNQIREMLWPYLLMVAQDSKCMNCVPDTIAAIQGNGGTIPEQMDAVREALFIAHNKDQKCWKCSRVDEMIPKGF